MKRTFFLIAAVAVTIASCNSQPFKTAKDGLEYKIIKKGNSKDAVKYGNTLKFKVYQYYNDSLMSTPFDTIPQLAPVDSLRIPPEYAKIFLMAHKGDSIITRFPTDSLAKRRPLPPFAKPHQYVGTHFMIVDVISDSTQLIKAHEEQETGMRRADSLSKEKQKGIDDATIQSYLKKNNITAQKTPEGTYVEVIEKGTGDAIDSGKAVSVLYKGMLLDGTIFDQSYDSTGKPKAPFTFKVGEGGAIPGWSDGMVYFNKGGKGKLFIPSGRAYGSRGAGGDIKPNTPIMFDVNIVDVLTPEQYDKSMEAQRKEMQEMQKKRMEEMQKQQKQKKDAPSK